METTKDIKSVSKKQMATFIKHKVITNYSSPLITIMLMTTKIKTPCLQKNMHTILLKFRQSFGIKWDNAPNDATYIKTTHITLAPRLSRQHIFHFNRIWCNQDFSSIFFLRGILQSWEEPPFFLNFVHLSLIISINSYLYWKKSGTECQ